MLAIWNRCDNPEYQPEISRSFRGSCGKLICSSVYSISLIHLLPLQIDPNRTISAGKVDIGAFRTYPENYTSPDASASEYQSIPLEKIEDFGVHANQYYALEVEVFKSSLDTELLGLLWNKYWVNTLSTSPLISVRLPHVSCLNKYLKRCTESSIRCLAALRSCSEACQSTVSCLIDTSIGVCSSKGRQREGVYARRLFILHCNPSNTTLRVGKADRREEERRQSTPQERERQVSQPKFVRNRVL